MEIFGGSGQRFGDSRWELGIKGWVGEGEGEGEGEAVTGVGCEDGDPTTTTNDSRNSATSPLALAVFLSQYAQAKADLTRAS